MNDTADTSRVDGMTQWPHTTPFGASSTRKPAGQIRWSWLGDLPAPWHSVALWTSITVVLAH